MTEKILSTVIKLRRDNDYNYSKVKDTFIPANGEPILVDTARDGLRVKIGDGVSTYDKLEFADSLFINGYLYGEAFYSDPEHTSPINGVINRLYINLSNGSVYYYNGAQYLLVNGSPTATSNTAGVMILYNTTGQNTDGTMTQKAITDELNDKFEMNVVPEDEMLVFDRNIS